MDQEHQAPERAVRGRPTKYRPEYVYQATKLCALGATDRDLADFFGVAINAIWRWSTKYPEFRSALKSSKESADERVERSLYQKACGYTFDAVKIFMPASHNEPVYAKYREHVPPDTTACIFWLKNRQPNQWRERVQQEHVGPDGGAIVHRIERAIIDPAHVAN